MKKPSYQILITAFGNPANALAYIMCEESNNAKNRRASSRGFAPSSSFLQKDNELAFSLPPVSQIETSALHINYII